MSVSLRGVDNGVREDKTIEYKQVLPSKETEDVKEFLADVSSFANASGGDIVFGIKAERDEKNNPTGLPKELVGLLNFNPDQDILRLGQIVHDGIQPRIQGIRFVPVLDSSAASLVMRIPESWIAPHMVTYRGSQRFYVRTNAGKTPLDVHELRDALLKSQEVPNRIQNFRDGRLGNILSGRTPVLLHDGPIVVLHVVPYSAVMRPDVVDLAKFDRGQLRVPLMGPESRGQAGRFNLDGYVAHYGFQPPNEAHIAYSQLFRDSSIEIVDTEILQRYHCRPESTIPTLMLEGNVQRTLHAVLDLYSKLEVMPPVAVMLSLLHVRNFTLISGGYRQDVSTHPIDRGLLVLPDVLVTDIHEPPDRILRPVFDLIWQACGKERCLHYDDQGNWVKPPQ